MQHGTIFVVELVAVAERDYIELGPLGQVRRLVHDDGPILHVRPVGRHVVEYVIAVCASRHGIELHAFCAMSNHLHQVGTDPRGQVVEFERDCHAVIARALNAMHGDFESVWSREPCCRVTFIEPSDVLDNIADTLANPVAAGLVAEGRRWPGVRRAWPMKPRTIRRPAGFFRDEPHGGSWPEEVALELHRPPGNVHLTDDELATLLRGEVEREEAKARSSLRSAGRCFLGRRGVRRQSRYSYPTSKEKRFAIRPSIAARSKWARIEALHRNRAWLERYARARDELRAGNFGVLFPHGTWKLRVYLRVACEPPPANRSIRIAG